MRRAAVLLQCSIVAGLVAYGEDVGRPGWAVVDPALPAGAPRYERGKARGLYDELCRECHGAGGRGDGPAARYLMPRPRDFVAGMYRFRSTASGEPALPEDLFATLGRGLHGTAMPSWAGLDAAERWQLVMLLRELSPRFAVRRPVRRLVVGEVPRGSGARVESGRAAYVRLGCAQCHGDEGRGDGPAAATLRDDAGRAAPPANLRRPEHYHGGCAPEDLYRTLYTGLDGAPMPAYEALTSDEAWDLAFYLRSLVVDPARCGRAPG